MLNEKRASGIPMAWSAVIEGLPNTVWPIMLFVFAGLDDRSCMNREVHVQFWESVGV